MSAVVASPDQQPAQRPRARRTAADIPIHAPANCAYGFILDDEILRRWAKVFHEESYGDALKGMSPKEAETELKTAVAVTTTMLTPMVYKAHPRIPRLWGRLVLMDGVKGTYMLILKDNRSEKIKNTRIASEDVAGIKTMLGLGNQTAKWYRIFPC